MSTVKQISIDAAPELNPLTYQKLNEMIRKAVEDGYVQKKIAQQEYEFQKGLEKGEYIKVGVNKYRMEEESQNVELHEYDEESAEKKIKELKELKKTRDNRKVKESLKELKNATKKGENVMPYLVTCCKAYATVGEMADVFREVYGEFNEPNIFSR